MDRANYSQRVDEPREELPKAAVSSAACRLTLRELSDLIELFALIHAPHFDQRTE